MNKWAWKNGVIDLGEPTQNAYAESFNGKFRKEYLNGHWFYNLEEARMTAKN